MTDLSLIRVQGNVWIARETAITIRLARVDVAGHCGLLSSNERVHR